MKVIIIPTCPRCGINHPPGPGPTRLRSNALSGSNDPLLPHLPPIPLPQHKAPILPAKCDLSKYQAELVCQRCGIDHQSAPYHPSHSTIGGSLCQT